MSRTRIDEELGNAGLESAREAIRQYAEGNLPRFCMEAARSLELCGKAILARLSPVLIADPKSVPSQLHLAGHRTSEGRPQMRAIRTISCREVIARLALVIRGLKPDAITPIIDSRDGSTHYLVDEHGALEALVVPYLTAMSLIESELAINDTIAFLGDAELVAKLREEHAKAVDRVVAAKMSRARQELEERFEDFPAITRTEVIAALTSGYDLEPYDQVLVTCPVCGEKALASGEHQFEGWSIGRRGEAFPDIVLWAEELECRVCRLNLDSSEELKAAGVETLLSIEDADPDDFVDFDDTPDE